MNVAEFVQKTLTQIARGVHEAQPAMKEHGVGLSSKLNEHIQKVEFDIALGVTEETGGSGGISVAGILKTDAQSSGSESSISRIKFGVVVDFTKYPSG